jgi:phage terminase small subunit
MSQEIVEKKAQPLTELTEMQKRFCEYLIFNEGRTTHQDAALYAGYSPKRAAVEASELLRNPKIQTYIAKRSADVNRSFAVTKHNYVRRQQVLSQKLVDDGKIKDALGFETLIGKATGQFSETNYNVNINATDIKEREAEIKRLKELNEKRITDTKLLKE